ncbi:hypothetical protein VMCG_10234 [Cytospora schulzeri]|uniref:Uncharacterized protein n=1 Tax=Cytospora schulzeri TaxID=448051 RepID=A0A423VEM8_9PEZI|nr:hypothetical protein VMCG_10234 [Valsa malicola]
MTSPDPPKSGIPNMIEGFKPLELHGQVESASQRLQHIKVNNVSGAFGRVIAQQWRVDSTARRDTWAVVDSMPECMLLYHDLTSGRASEGPLIGGVQVVVVTDSTAHWDSSGYGQLKIITFNTLVLWLTQRFSQEWRWWPMLGSPTIVMNFGWGNTTSEMAIACLGVVKLVDKNLTEGIMACTVSSGKEIPFGHGQRWKSIQVQRVKVCITGPKSQPKGLHQPITAVDQAARLSLVADKLSELGKKAQSAGDKKRILLLMDKTDANMIINGPGMIKLQALENYSQLKNEGVDMNFTLDKRVVNISSVDNVGAIVVYPYTTAYVAERGQAGLCKGTVPRSRKEMCYRTQFSCGSDFQPQIHYMMRSEELQDFPEDDEHSEAHTMHLPSVLLRGFLLWEDVPFAEMPVNLPYDKRVFVKEQIGRLIRPGLIRVKCFNPLPDLVFLGKFYGDAVLTDVGRKTAMVLLMGNVESLNSACLLGQLMSKEGRDRVGLALDSAVIDAIFTIAAVTETYDGVTHLGYDVSLSHEGDPGRRDWYKKTLTGVAADYVCRGPIWLAVAIWQKLRDDANWRGDAQAFDTNTRPDNLTVNRGSIVISSHGSMRWDGALEKMKNVRVPDVPPPELRQNASLTASALFAVEKAMVYAFLDKIACVQPGLPEFTAWDLLTQRRLATPVEWQWGQVWLEDCLQGDSVHGRRPPVAFCIYTFLQLVHEDDERVWRPYDLTYVSFGAVRHVLSEVRNGFLMRSVSNLVAHLEAQGE